MLGILAALSAALALLPGCGPGESPAFAPAAWSFNDLNGNTHALADYRGHLVVLDLWATWCLPCRTIMPEMQQLHEQYRGRKVVILGGNTYERSDPAPLVRELGLTYPQLLETDPLANALGVAGLPAVIVYGLDGTIVYQHLGSDPASLAALKAFIANYAEKHDL